MSGEGFTIAVAVNDTRVLEGNLFLSPGLLDGGRNEVLIKRQFRSAALAYNSAIDEAVNDLIVFVHQDVYLPESWFGDLNRCLQSLEERRANWGVLGCFGSRRDAEGGLGRVYTNGLGVHGRNLVEPEPVETLDEIVLVVRRSSGLRFDPLLPHFHLYGTEICMSARARGLTNYAFQGFCIHNTNQVLKLPREFYRSYRYVRRKWKRYLPIYASCVTISQLNGDSYRRRFRDLAELAIGRRRLPKLRVDDPRTVLSNRRASLDPESIH